MSENESNLESNVVEKPCLKRKRTEEDDDYVAIRCNTGVESELEVEMNEPVIDLQVEPINLKAGQPVDSQVEEPVVQEGDLQIDLGAEEQVDSQIDEAVDPQIEEVVDSQIEEAVNSQIEEADNSQIEEVVDLQIEEVVDTQIDEAVNSQIEQPVDPQIEVQVDENMEDETTEEQVVEEQINETPEQKIQEVEQVVEQIEHQTVQLDRQINEPSEQHDQIEDQTDPQIVEPTKQQDDHQKLQQQNVQQIQEQLEQEIHLKLDQQIVQVEQQINQQVEEKIKHQLEHEIQAKIDEQIQEKVDQQIVQVEQQIKSKLDQQIQQQVDQQINQKLNQQKQSKENSKSLPVVPEWFITNTQKAKEDQLQRLKELKEELMAELSHQFNNTVDRVVKNDKEQFEKQILRAMQHCFLDVENELSSKNLLSLKNGNSLDGIEPEDELMEQDEEEEEEGEIKSSGPEEKTDDQKDKDLIKKLKIILDNLSANDCSKVYGKLGNMKVQTKAGAQIVMDLIISKAKEMPKLSYELVNRLVRITDYDPAFLHLRELLLKRFENDLANGTIVDEVEFFGFVAKKGYLIPDSFVSRCIYFIVENECNVNVEFLCEFVNIAGEHYRNFPFMIDCIQKLENIAASGKYGKDITGEINQLIYRRDMLWC